MFLILDVINDYIVEVSILNKNNQKIIFLVSWLSDCKNPIDISFILW